MSEIYIKKKTGWKMYKTLAEITLIKQTNKLASQLYTVKA